MTNRVWNDVNLKLELFIQDMYVTLQPSTNININVHWVNNSIAVYSDGIITDITCWFHSNCLLWMTFFYKWSAMTCGAWMNSIKIIHYLPSIKETLFQTNLYSSFHSIIKLNQFNFAWNHWMSSKIMLSFVSFLQLSWIMQLL